jgi:hypothetical protein
MTAEKIVEQWRTDKCGMGGMTNYELRMTNAPLVILLPPPGLPAGWVPASMPRTSRHQSMNLRLPNISPTRRLFLGAVVAVVLAVGWVVTEPLRTDVQNHYVGGASLINWITGRGGGIKLEGEEIYWDFISPNHGILTFVAGYYGWEVAPYREKSLESISYKEIQNATFVQKSSSPSPSADVILPIKLVASDNDIVIVRRQRDARIIYAIQAVEQKDGRGHFRSRRILPAAGAGGSPSNAFPVAPTNR